MFKELNLFLSMTQKIELFFFFRIRLNESIPFFWMWLNWNFGWKSQKLNFFLLKNWTFLHMTRRIEFFFSRWLKELNPVWNMIQRIVFEFRLKELNILLFDSKSWAFFLLDAMHWTFFLFAAKNSLSHIGKQERFNSLSHIREKSWILWVVLENFNSSSRMQKKKVQCRKKVIFKKKKQVLWFVLKKYSSVIRIRTSKKKFHFESHSEKKRINSSSHFFWVKNILKRRFKSVSHKKSNYLSFFFVEKNQVFESCYKEGFNSSSHIGKNLWVKMKKKKTKLHLFESYWKEVLNKRFNSLSHMKKFKYLSHFGKKENKINSLSHIFLKMVWFFRVFQKKNRFLYF